MANPYWLLLTTAGPLLALIVAGLVMIMRTAGATITRIVGLGMILIGVAGCGWLVYDYTHPPPKRPDTYFGPPSGPSTGPFRTMPATPSDRPMLAPAK